MFTNNIQNSVVPMTSLMLRINLHFPYLLCRPLKIYEILAKVRSIGGAMFVTEGLMLGLLDSIVKKREEMPYWIIKERQV